MKLEKENSLNLLLYIDVLMGFFLLILSLSINNKYTFVIFLGFLLAVLNFYINSITTNYALMKDKKNPSIIIISFIFRVFIAVFVGGLLYINNKNNALPYILGYSFHIISLLIYGLLLKKEVAS